MPSSQLRMVICLLAMWGLPLQVQAEAFAVEVAQRQLFLDYLGIYEITRLRRTMHQPDKRGAVLRSSSPKHTFQIRSAPKWDPQEKVFKIWVGWTDHRYFTSPDGLNWSAGPRPDINLAHVAIDLKDPDPARRYKTAMGSHGFAVSPDGIHWTKLDLPGIPSQDESNFSHNPEAGLFIHTVKRSGPYGRAVAVATSTDFENWTDYGLIFHADKLDQELGRKRIAARLRNPNLKQTEYDTPERYSVQVYNMGVFLYEGLFIGMPSMFHTTGVLPPGWPGFEKMNLSPGMREAVRNHGDWTGFYNVELACSRDLKNWLRLGDRKPFIEASPVGGGAYDLQCIIGPSEPVVRGDELWFYYTGIKQYALTTSGDQPGYDDYVPDAGAACLAVLRRDGFISLDADEPEGVVVTRSFRLPAGKLLVNVACGKSGELRAEVRGSDDKVLARSGPVTGDQVRGQLDWQEGDLAALTGQSVQLRFSLRNASFYSYWFE